jgi:hypothetical protein
MTVDLLKVYRNNVRKLKNCSLGDNRNIYLAEAYTKIHRIYEGSNIQ